MADMGKVFVYENWKSPNPGKMGTLHMDGGKGREVVSFEYDENWLQDTVERNWRKLAPGIRIEQKRAGAHGSGF